ncbi:MAG: hypothetical protein AB8H86_12595 [Polyangiales bacterium]
MSRRGTIRATHAESQWTFRLDQEEGPAFARLGRWRLTHLEAAKPWLRELKSALTQDPGEAGNGGEDGEDEERAAAWFAAALSAAGGRCLAVRWQASEFPWPAWPEELRLGFPSAGALWPADFELLGLWLGTRRVAKRDALSPEATRRRIAWWREQGVVVSVVDGVVLGALDEATLAEAVAAQRALTSDEDMASSFFGDALGYPPCCVRAYLELAARDDAAMADARLGGAGGPPENGFLIGPLALLSHTPCSPQCKPSASLARRLLKAMDARAPGFEARWRRVATGVWGLDASGRAWVFGGGATVSSAYRLDGGAHESLRFRGEALDSSGPASLDLTFYADHRRNDP